MRLSGVRIQNFRSIGQPGVNLHPLRKTNILIGQNNAGKSNVIRAIYNITSFYENKDSRTRQKQIFQEIDLHKRSSANQFSYDLLFSSDEQDTEEQKKWSKFAHSAEFKFVWRANHDTPANQNIIVHTLTTGNQAKIFLDSNTQYTFKEYSSVQSYEQEIITNRDSIFARGFASAIPVTHVIPEFRRISTGGTYNYTGENLIGLLAEYQRPEHDKEYRSKKHKFDLIEDLVRRLLHLPNAYLEIPHTKDQIYINNEAHG